MGYNIRSKKKKDEESQVKSEKKEEKKTSSNGGIRQTRFIANLTLFFMLVILGFSGVFFFFTKLAPKNALSGCSEVMSIQYIVSGVLPLWLGGRDDKMGTVKELWTCTHAYKQDNPYYTILGFSVVYITLQTFAIPGAITLSILAGALYPFFWAQVLIACCATSGASLCYFLSYLIGHDIADTLFPTMIKNFREKIRDNRGNLFYYMLFLRLTPFLPNWFVNIACPLVDVDFIYFFMGTLLGLIPGNIIHVTTGMALNNTAEDATTGSMMSNIKNFGILFCLQFIALLPTMFKGKIEEIGNSKFGKKSE